ncbi:MAG: hypothetical protein HC897_14690 [Thermoanaerobaculia bacterium]|nr:hypothetical protein [Thermoanaerobaculia bacterium]
MAQTLTINDAASHFLEYLRRVTQRGERFLLVRDSLPVAELRPVPASKRLADLPALCASLPHLSPTEATDFADDLAKAREELARSEAHDPWRS